MITIYIIINELITVIIIWNNEVSMNETHDIRINL